MSLLSALNQVTNGITATQQKLQENAIILSTNTNSLSANQLVYLNKIDANLQTYKTFQLTQQPGLESAFKVAASGLQSISSQITTALNWVGSLSATMTNAQLAASYDSILENQIKAIDTMVANYNVNSNAISAGVQLLSNQSTFGATTVSGVFSNTATSYTATSTTAPTASVKLDPVYTWTPQRLAASSFTLGLSYQAGTTIAPGANVINPGVKYLANYGANAAGVTLTTKYLSFLGNNATTTALTFKTTTTTVAGVVSRTTATATTTVFQADSAGTRAVNTGGITAVSAVLNAALETIEKQKALLTTYTNALMPAAANVSSVVASLTETESKIEEPDQAAIQFEINQLNNQTSISYYVISQLNVSSAAVLKIFQ